MNHRISCLPITHVIQNHGLTTDTGAQEDFELLDVAMEVEVNIWNGVYENERYFYPRAHTLSYLRVKPYRHGVCLRHGLIHCC